MDVAAVLICKDENEYLLEWCEWHYAIGFDSLIVFDDHSRLPLAETVSSFPAPLIDAIEVIPWNDTSAHRQQLSYLCALRNRGDSFDWMAFLDTDEFIVLKQDASIKTFLARYEDYAGIAINWQVFGANGKESRSGSQIDTLTWRATTDHGVNRHVKSIVQPQNIVDRCPGAPHSFLGANGLFTVNEQGARVDGPFSSPVSVQTAQINHYYLRSREEYLHKCNRGRADCNQERDGSLFDKIDAEMSEVEDLMAVKIKQELLPHIQCLFDFQELYREAVERALDGAVFVEIGCWYGKSTAYLARQVKESSKQISLFAVDTWAGSPCEELHRREVRRAGGSLYPCFIENMKKADVIDGITALCMTSQEAAQQFEDRSVDFVFIDASHEYTSVKKDIETWLPKLKPSGVMAEHDYPGWPGVVRAVDETLPDAVQQGSCWIRRSPGS